MEGIGGYTIFIIFPQYCAKYRVSRSYDYTQTLMSMLSKQEIHTEHAQSAKLLHFLSKPYVMSWPNIWLCNSNYQICLLIWLIYNTKLKSNFVLFYFDLYLTEMTKNSFPDLLDTEIVFPDSILCVWPYMANCY